MDGLGEQQELNFSIMPPALTVTALRDSGYKDTDHALAELIDNSIDAGARLVELIAVETPPDPDVAYARPRVTNIAVADDGTGMDASTLRHALRFGVGTRQDRSARTIGRFGIGLPNASISQCLRVDIWTWQNGADNAMHCYLDVDDVSKGATAVPEPTHDPVPARWRRVADCTSGPSGTLVVWSKLDRVSWSGAKKTLERTAELCGRVYRRFLARKDSPVSILLTLARQSGDRLDLQESPTACAPNDPLYLTAPSSTPIPFDTQPMFRPFNQRKWTIAEGDHQGDVHVVCSLVKREAIVREDPAVEWPSGNYTDAGRAPWGKHAARNQGVSIVRADRELELSHAWTNSYDTRERWWAVEVSFDPGLDELFGVTNNKQHAHNFVDGANFSLEEEAYSDESSMAVLDRMVDSGDKRAHLVKIWEWIDKQLEQMRIEYKNFVKGKRTQSRHPDTATTSEDAATAEINQQAERGEVGATDRQPLMTPVAKEQELIRILDQRKVANAQQTASAAIENGRRIIIDAGDLGHEYAFFDVESVNDTIAVILNQRHPVYSHLFESLLADVHDDEDTDELLRRLQRALYSLEMLIFAWCRYEDKASLQLTKQLEKIRMDWGREAGEFLDPVEHG